MILITLLRAAFWSLCSCTEKPATSLRKTGGFSCLYAVHALHVHDHVKTLVPVVVAYCPLGLGLSGGIERGGCTPVDHNSLMSWRQNGVFQVALSYSDGVGG